MQVLVCHKTAERLHSLRNTLHFDYAVRLDFTAYRRDFLHNAVKTALVRIDSQLLCHKAHIGVLHAVDLFNSFFHFRSAVCAIQILHFTDLKNIRPIFFDKTYHAVVEAGGDKAYELLRQAMFDEGKVAIAKTVMGQSEKLLCLIPTEKGILAETLFFYDEVKEIPKEAAHPELNEAELNMAKMLIGSMDKEFEPQLYHNEYQVRLREIIEAKINGQEIVQTPAEQESNVINIMEALQASLQQIEGTTPPKKPRGRKKAATA